MRTQIRELQSRCERLEKEKSEILMRRLSTMESISSKASPNEIQKLQKKNEALVQEKNNLLTKIRELEKEANSKMFRGERDREKDELRSKLKAAENLCENLMDENEDMKKEIRQLEEEIYELQDTFRTSIWMEDSNTRMALLFAKAGSKVDVSFLESSMWNVILSSNPFDHCTLFTRTLPSASAHPEWHFGFRLN